MTELKREYVVPLRRKVRLAPKWRRSKKAVSVLNDFIVKHMKTDNVVICKELNEEIWKRGIKNPPGKVEVIALKTQIGGVEKTLVNLLSVGIDSQLESYDAQSVEAMPIAKEKSVDKKAEVKSEVKDAQVKEVKPESKTKEVKDSMKEVNKK